MVHDPRFDCGRNQKGNDILRRNNLTGALFLTHSTLTKKINVASTDLGASDRSSISNKKFLDPVAKAVFYRMSSRVNEHIDNMTA